MTNCAQWKFFHAYKYKDDSNEMEPKLNPRGQLNTNPGGGGAWVNVCWVCAAGLSEPLPHYNLFFGQL